MPEINVLIAGNGVCAPEIKKSKYLKKLYVTGDKEIDGAVLIKFNTFKELAQKCKALQIDIVIVENEKWILQGIADVLKSNLVNCIAPTSKWTELALSPVFAREIVQKYSIDTPKLIKLPVDFPIVLKAKGITKKADSLQELIDYRQELDTNYPHLSDSVYLEKYIDGKTVITTSLFDGKHLITFPDNSLRGELLSTYNQNLERMFIEKSADFTGFINSKLILSEDKLYNIGFSFEYLKPNCNSDLLYILLSAIYQKLNEIRLFND